MKDQKSTDKVIHIRSGQKMGKEQAELYDFVETVAKKSKSLEAKPELQKRLSKLGRNAAGEAVVIAADGTETPLED